MVSGRKTPDHIIAKCREYAAQERSANWVANELNIGRDQAQKYMRGYRPDEGGRESITLPPSVAIQPQAVGPVKGEPWWYRYGVQHDDGHKIIMSKMPDKILCFGDMQANFQHQDTIPFLCAVIARHKPDAFVMMGDEADLTGLKKHFMNAESLGPAQELEQAIDFMQEVFKIVPEAIALTSNHIHDRLSYAQGQGNIPNIMMRKWADIIGAPKGWIWRDYIIWDKWLFEHGQKIAKGSRPNLLEGVAKRFNRHLSIMRGHHHSELGEHIKPVWMPEYWQARQCFTGCLMDYRKAGYSRDAVMVGCVVLDKGVPHPIPMPVDEGNRWVGKLVEA
jgi:hypothetical protein